MKTQIIFFLAFLLTGCSIFGSGDDTEKIVKGVYIVDETGLELGQWRKPPDYEAFYPPYPHPSPWGFSIAFNYEMPPEGIVSINPEVTIRIEPIRESGETSSGYRQEYGADQIIDGYVYEETISLEDYGVFVVSLPTEDRGGNRLPRGFYRIHLEDEYHDVFVPGPDESSREAVEYLNEIE